MFLNRQEISTFPLTQYDAVFVDGHHDYSYVSNDVKNYGQLTSRLALHDVHDHACKDVRRMWNELRAASDLCGFESMEEFVYHSHGDELMGIGLIKLNDAGVLKTCPYIDGKLLVLPKSTNTNKTSSDISSALNHKFLR